MPSMVSAVCPMTPVRQQVDDRAQAEKHVRQHTEDVGSVLFPQEKKSDGQEEAEAQPNRDAQRIASCFRFSCGRHGGLLHDQAAFAADDGLAACQRRAKRYRPPFLTERLPAALPLTTRDAH